MHGLGVSIVIFEFPLHCRGLWDCYLGDYPSIELLVLRDVSQFVAL